MSIEAVIFDMDGLMVDSERVYEEIFKLATAEMNREHSHELILRTTGMNNAAWRAEVQKFYGEDFDLEFFADRCDILMEDWVEEKGIPLKDGLIELLEYLKEKQIPCAVASSTYTKKAMRLLSKVGIDGYFTGFMFGDMVERSKPEPDIFLAAAKLLGKEPATCMGLEDSFNGIRACNAAGLYTVMVPDLLQPTEEIRALTDNCVATL
ncbi:MAG: HAD family phosphatase, partial [Angelakisella sp.]